MQYFFDLSNDKEPPDDDNGYKNNNNYDCDNRGKNNTDSHNDGYDDGYYDAGYNNGYGYDDYDNYEYDDDGYYDNDGYHWNSHHSNSDDATGLNNTVDELETDLQLLWDTFWSLSTKHTFVGHRLDQVLCTTTSPQPFKLVGSTSPGGVHSTSLGRVNCGHLHL